MGGGERDRFRIIGGLLERFRIERDGELQNKSRIIEKFPSQLTSLSTHRDRLEL